MGKKKYQIKIRTGYHRYVIDKLVGVLGRKKREVLEQIVNEWASDNWQILRDRGITLEGAREEGYVPRVKKKK